MVGGLDIMVFLGKEEFLKFLKTSEEIKHEITQLKEESNEHLDAINENTNEIQSNYNYVCDLDKKISKLNEKVDEISAMLKTLMEKQHFVEEKDEVDVQQLSVPEKKIFLTLYTSENLLSYKDIAFSTNLTETLVSQYVTNIIEKGVPVIKQYRQGRPYIGITSQFKEIQAKNNLVNLS